jgi:hypothetical protein
MYAAIECMCSVAPLGLLQLLDRRPVAIATGISSVTPFGVQSLDPKYPFGVFRLLGPEGR